MESSPSPDEPVAQSSRRKTQRSLNTLICALALTIPLQSFAQSDPTESRVPLGTHPILNAIPETGIPITGPATVLRGSVPPRIRAAADLGPVASDKNLSIVFHLNRHDRKGMDALVKRIYTPGDPLYHQYLSVGERTRLFSPTSQEALTVARYAQSQGFTVVDIAEDRSIVQVAGTVSQVHKSFGVNIHNYHDKATFHGDFFAPDRDAQLPNPVAKLVCGIDGLTDANRPQRARTPRMHAPGLFDWWPFDNGLTAGLIRTVYGLNGLKLNGTPLNGSGQTLALVEYGDLDTSNLDGYISYNAVGYDTTDLAANGTQLTLKKPKVVKIGSAPFNNDQGEAELDLNMVVALADGLSTVYVYEGDSGTTVFTKVKNDNKTKVISYSYGSKEINNDPASLDAFSLIFEEMALQGQNVFASSGDQGDYVPNDPHGSPNNYQKTTEVPADSPYVTGVGGTVITFSQVNYGWKGETTWNSNANSAGGGGVSTHFPIPWYQQDYLGSHQDSLLSDMLGTGAMNHFRSVPDVSLNSVHYYSYSAGSGHVENGTSASAPLWAAFTAIVNQGRAILGADSIGFLNPVLYRIASNPTSYANDFHDINDYSNNANYVTGDGYQAVTGYDAATGLGSFNGINLIHDLLLADHAWYIGLKASAPGVPLGTSIDVGSGSPVTFTATLAEPAPVDSTVVLKGSGADKTYYGTITIPANQLSGSTVVTAPYVQVKNMLSIQGTYSLGGVKPIISVAVHPLTVNSFTFPAGSIYSGNPGDTILGTVTLNGVAPKDEVLSVQLKTPSFNVSFPRTITITKGSSTGTVPIEAVNGGVGSEQQIQVWVNTLGTDIVRNIYKANLLLEPAPVVTGVTITPRDPNGATNSGKVLSGLSATGTVTLQSPALGMGVSMTVPSSYAGVHPVNFTVAPGQTTATFILATDQSLTDYTAQLEAGTTYNTGGSAKPFSLLVQGHQPFIQTTTTVSSSAPTAIDGSPVTITAKVRGTSGVPTGSVYFSVPGVSIPLDQTGTATIVMPNELSLPPGTYHFDVSYAGDGLYQPSNGTVTEVLLPPTKVNLTANPTTAIQSQTIYYVAGIASKPGIPMPTGTITFVDKGAGPGQSVTLGTQQLDGAGLAFFSDNSLLPYQTHLIVANYSGDSNYPAGFTPTPINITVNPCSITGKVVSSNNPSPIGAPITYTATFSVPANANLPAGTVLLIDNDNIIDQQPYTAANKGVVVFHESGQTAGSHNIQVQYIANVPGMVCSADMTETISGNLGQTTLIASASLTRSTTNRSLDAYVTIKNTGANSAGSITITSATLNGSSTVTATPLSLWTLNPGDSNAFHLQFGNILKGRRTLVLQGTYDDGSVAGATFTQTFSVTVP